MKTVKAHAKAAQAILEAGGDPWLAVAHYNSALALAKAEGQPRYLRFNHYAEAVCAKFQIARHWRRV